MAKCLYILQYYRGIGVEIHDSRGEGDQACGTTAVMRLGFSHVRVIL